MYITGKLRWSLDASGVCCADVAVYEFSHCCPSGALAQLLWKSEPGPV